MRSDRMYSARDYWRRLAAQPFCEQVGSIFICLGRVDRAAAPGREPPLALAESDGLVSARQQPVDCRSARIPLKETFECLNGADEGGGLGDLR